MQEVDTVIGKNELHALSMIHETQADKPPIVFIHMSWGGVWAFKMFMRFFYDAGWDSYAVDLRGHGMSGGKVAGATMGDYVTDVEEVVEHFKLKKPVVIGHSMGGLIALMYAAKNTVSGAVSIDGSPSAEVQGEGHVVTYPEEYEPVDVGMPGEMEEAMMAFPDLSKEQLMNMRSMLKTESGVARSERKLGISIPKKSLKSPLLFVGAENGASVPFGIGAEKSQKMADYYGVANIVIEKASHPGILMGTYWGIAAKKIDEWLKSKL